MRGLMYSLDLETTGIDKFNCKMMEIALVPCTHTVGGTVVQDPRYTSFHARLRVPGGAMACDPRALEVNGLNPAEGLPPRTVMRDLLVYLRSMKCAVVARDRGDGRAGLVGRNVAIFDALILERYILSWWGGVLWGEFFTHRVRDTAGLCLLMQDMGMEFPPSPRDGRVDSTSVYRAMTGDMEVKAPHTALRDATLQPRVWSWAMSCLSEQTMFQSKLLCPELYAEWEPPQVWVPDGRAG